MTPHEHLTPGKIEELRREIPEDGVDNGYAATVMLDAFEVIEDLQRRNKKLERLYQALKTVVDDKSYAAGGLRCSDDCNSYHAWGKNAKCDCYVKDVIQAMRSLGGNVLDDLADEIENQESQ